mmetsp:Transcript_49078/g.87563  ORF Transcript_49078/g.87563 Transcript_49078/m.87563 type:complete len:91 (+) Transcript_49078:10751-11023(+)
MLPCTSCSLLNPVQIFVLVARLLLPTATHVSFSDNESISKELSTLNTRNKMHFVLICYLDNVHHLRCVLVVCPSFDDASSEQWGEGCQNI